MAATEPDEPAELPDEPAELPDEPTCPACGSPAPTGAAWCEACGADLDASEATAVPAAPCVSCDAPPQDITSDGYCSNCGQKQPAKRDHLEYEEGAIVAVTDRGKRHHRNEDACAIAALGTTSILVVCDGVSSTDRPDEASQAAVDKIVDVLRSAIEHDGEQSDTFDLADHAAIEALLTTAIAEAHSEVSAVTSSIKGAEPPSCTVVAAVTRSDDDAAFTTVAWLGDSRAYWIDADGTMMQLTTDHSWSVEQLAIGDLTADEIAADKRAHSITRWLGADAADVTPDILHIKKPPSGRLLLCSDGLWNYAPTPEALADEVAKFDGSALDLARGLVDFANQGGGHDNITVALTTSADTTERTTNGDVQR